MAAAALVLTAAAQAALPAFEAHAQREPARSETDFADALALFHEHLYEPSAEAFAAFRARYPESIHVPEAYFYQATARLALGQEERAAALFRQLRRAYPAHPLATDAQLSLGRYFLEEGDYARAEGALLEVVESRPGTPQAARALYALGEAALDNDDPEAAMGYFRQVAEDFSETDVADDALYALGATQLDQDQSEAAAQSLESLARRYPGSPYARTLGLALAEVYYDLERYEEAIAEIDRRLPELEGEARERARFLRADSYNQLRDSENAVVYYRQIIEENPDSPYYRPARYGLAWNYHFENAHQWAADEFAAVREGFEDDLAAQALYYEAVNRALTGRTEEPIRLYNAFLRQFPDHALAEKAQFELGAAYYETEQWPEAAHAFEMFLDDYPDAEKRGEAFYLRGNALAATGDFDAALESLSEAVAAGGAFEQRRAEVAFQRAWLLYRGERFRQAAEAFAQFLETYPDDPKAADALFWAGESFYQTERYARAADVFRQYLSRNPQGEHANAARYALGWTFFKQGQYADAAQSFERFLQSYRNEGGDIPYAQDARLRLADSYYALKDYDQAVRAYQGVGGENRDYALYQMSQALYLSDRSAEATGALRELLEDFPESGLREEARYRLGYFYFQDQNYDQAAQAYRAFIEQYPRDPLAAKAQYGIADALFNDGRYDEALRAYRRVLERYPDSPFASDAASGIQYALTALGEDDRASGIIDSFATANPDAAVVNELRFRQAETKFQSGRTEEALQDFQRFVRTSNDEDLLPEAYYYLGDAFANQERYREAETYLRQVVQNYPQSARRPDAARRLGELYAQQDRHEEALSIYEQMAEMRPADPGLVAEARYGQSMALLNLGRPSEAQRLLEETADVAPNAPEATLARLGLARIYEEDGRTGEARRLYREVAREAEGEAGAEALYRLGTLLLEEGQPRQAIEQLSRLPDLFPEYPQWVARGYLTQARAYRSLGQDGNAAQVYEQVMNEFAGTAFAETAQRERASI